MSSLFDSEKLLGKQLANRVAPHDLGDFFGQERLLGKDGALIKLIETDSVPSSIFFGPPGCGKTALAKIIANRTQSTFIRLNAVTAKIEDLRKALARAEESRYLGQETILFIDEIHRFNKMVQDGLLPSLEEGVVTLIGTTTKNPYFYLIPPLRSRVLLFEFEPLSRDALSAIIHKAEIQEGFAIHETARKYIINHAGGDARRMLNLIQSSLQMGSSRVNSSRVNASRAHTSHEIIREDVEKVMGKQPLLYDRDEDYHYDVISAFIKSVRGTDPDAALYWLALMLESGEDPLYIARRLVILASEDIGLADSSALGIAVSAYHAVDMIGMPESRLILSHATLHLTLSPKSNSSYRAIAKAADFVHAHGNLEVPDYLKSSHRDNKNYKYPHDYPYHFVPQLYLKESVAFYVPGELGEERDMKRRLEFLRKHRQEKNEGGQTETEDEASEHS
jgi:putative ATPase